MVVLIVDANLVFYADDKIQESGKTLVPNQL